ncbi:hypothetical protein [Priestia megaterium]|uniref:hypothetical protein n=1 Tax=Priestia megaterium TaxID=1404 RepID=UPI003D2DA746
MTNYIPAIITASVALIVGVGAQFLNNWLTGRREKKKYLREVYENFISEFFVDILAHLNVSNQPRPDHDVKKDVNISTVIDEMFKKVHYGDRNLQSLSLERKTSKYLDDYKGDTEEILQIKICYFFLLYSQRIFKKIKFKLDLGVKFQLEHSIKEYAYWYICSEVKTYEEAKNKLKHLTSLSMSKKQILEQYSKRYFRKLIARDDLCEWKRFLTEVDEKMQQDSF